MSRMGNSVEEEVVVAPSGLRRMGRDRQVIAREYRLSFLEVMKMF